jgi:DNA primase catalytic subunit
VTQDVRSDSDKTETRESVLLREHYSGSKGLWLPPGATFRQFRFFLAGEQRNGAPRVVKVRDRIASIQTLRRWLVTFSPRHVYYSTGRWLDPQNLGPKELGPGSPGYQFAYNVFLSQELYFDIDVPGDLEEAKRWATKLRESLEREYSFRDVLLVYSGNKGFHLHVYDFDLADWVREISPHPAVRESQTQEVKAEMVNHLMDLGLVFDADVTVDTRRILRLPGTVHGKTFNICQIVDNIDTFRPQRLERG